jgi:hypothetical protein
MTIDLDVLLPFHKSNYFLEEAIKSLSSSEKIKFNTILIDDRIDKSKNLNWMFQKLSRYQVIETTGEIGYGPALKLGTQASTADALALFNSDDLIHPLRLFKQLKALERSSINFTNIRRITSRGRSSSFISGTISSKVYDPALLLLGSYGANASWCMQSEWWKKSSFFDNDDCLDWRIAMTTFPKAQILFINEFLYSYRRHNNQVTARRNAGELNFNSLYLTWKQLASKYHLNEFSFETFALLGMPWLRGLNINRDELMLAIASLKEIASNFEPSLKKNVNDLLNRRLLLAIRNNGSYFTKVELVVKGANQGPAILKDLITRLDLNRLKL